MVALTFDGGSGAQGAASVLSTLAATGVPATFFLTGRFVQLYPQTARAIAARGIVGNHTMTHPHVPQLSTSAVTREVTGDADAINSATGKSARPWFRFPFGEYDAAPSGSSTTSDTPLSAGRSTPSAGKVAPAPARPKNVVARVLTKLQPGMIVLRHLGAAPDGSTLDADALPRIISAVRAAGYSFVTATSLG